MIWKIESNTEDKVKNLEKQFGELEESVFKGFSDLGKFILFKLSESDGPSELSHEKAAEQSNTGTDTSAATPQSTVQESQPLAKTSNETATATQMATDSKAAGDGDQAHPQIAEETMD